MSDNTFDIKGGSNQVLPAAQEANQFFIGDLDLDDDNREFLVIDTIIPCSVVLDGSILDFIMEDQFADVDILEPGDLNTIMILNGTMSFHRSRRIEKKEQQGIIEFL